MNSKRKCKCCSEYYEAGHNWITTPVGIFYNYDHLQTYVKAQKALKLFRAQNKAKKEKKQLNAKQKREFYANDVKTRKAAAKAACHKYIRERDKGDKCICCELKLGEKFDAGHFLESGNNSFLRYHEDNIHAQSVHCNQYKGGDSGDYERNLRRKIGHDKVDYLLANKGGVVKRTAKDYKEIEDKYKRMLNDLAQ